MLQVTGTIDAPAAVAWRFLTDTHAWPHWGPSVRAVDTPARFIAAGMRGRVQTTPGPWLSFEITDWEEGTYWRWRVGGIPATGHHLTPSGLQRCEITFMIPTWAPIYVPVCRLALRRLAALATCDRTSSRGAALSYMPQLGDGPLTGEALHCGWLPHVRRGRW